MKRLVRDLRKEARGKYQNYPTMGAFKMNSVRGGMLFHMHHHHYTTHIMVWYGHER